MSQQIKKARRLIKAGRLPVLRQVIAPMTRFGVRKWDLKTHSLNGRQSLRIAVITDTHWGLPPMTGLMMEAAKRRVMALSPDIIVFLGDLAGGYNKRQKARNVQEGEARLSGLSAPLGLYAILGNHDWQDDQVAHARAAEPVAAAFHLEKAGFEVLQNRAVPIDAGAGLYLAGLDSQRAIKERPWFLFRRRGMDDLERTLSAVPHDAQVILLAHEPDIFPDLDDKRIVLTLSGHTHAGQIRLFDRPLATPSRHGTSYAYGHYQEGGRHLVVSAGLGSSTIPLRIGAMPEIALVTLRSEASQPPAVSPRP